MTRISDMTAVQVTSPTGMYAPVEKTGSTTNYRVDIAATMSVTPQMFGSVGNGATDDTAAIQAASDYVTAQGGGLLYHPNGNYDCASSIVLDSLYNLTFEGDSGSGTGYTSVPCRLTYSGTGSGRFISAQNTNAVTIRELGIRYSSGSFSGDLISLTNTNGGSDQAYGLVERCLVGGVGVNTARSLVSLEGAILSYVDLSHLQWGVVGVRGRKEIAPGNVLYSNANVITRNTFDNITTSAILNAGEGWAVIGNAFEGTNGGSGGMPRAYYDNLSTGSVTSGLAYLANWHGDAVNVTDAWFCNGLTEHRGLLIGGGLFDTASAAVPGIKLTGVVNGGAIVGTAQSGPIDLGSVAHRGLTVVGNYLGADVANLAATADDIVILGNVKGGGYAKNYLRLHTVQEFTVGSSSATAGTGVFTFSAPTGTDLQFNLHAQSGQARSIGFVVGSTTRAIIGTDPVAGNEDVVIITYNDAGTFVGRALKIARATMAATFGGAVAAPSIAVGGGTALTKAVVYTPSITPASVAAATVAEQTFTVTGLTTADKVIVNPPAISNATGVAGARVSAADTLAIRFTNPTAGALTPTAGTYTVLAFRS